MRYILLFILVIISRAVLSQKTFSGTYFTTKKDISFESDIFHFKKDGSFSYVFFTCTGTGLGKGKYQATDGYLHLKFENCEKCNEFNQIEYFNEESDSLEIDIKIISWEDKTPIIGASALIPNERIGATANLDGEVKFKTIKSNKTRTFKIEFVGFYPFKLEIPPTNSSIKGTIHLSNIWIYDSSEVNKFKLEKWKNSNLVLERYPDINISYDKIKFSKAKKIIKNSIGENGYNFFKEKVGI